MAGHELNKTGERRGLWVCHQMKRLCNVFYWGLHSRSRNLDRAHIVLYSGLTLSPDFLYVYTYARMAKYTNR